MATITDADGNVTTIERDASGNPTKIIGPFGQETMLTADANGYVNSIAAPTTQAAAFTYSADGLMQTITSPNGDASTYSYDTSGRLTLVRDPEDDPSGGDTLARTPFADGYTVTHTSAEGYATDYSVQFLSDGQQMRTNAFPDGTTQTMAIATDGSRTTTERDGTEMEVIDNPDPRFGLQALTTQDITVTTPDGTTATLTSSRDATLSDPNDPLSLLTQTDTFGLNGRNFTSAYAAGTQTFTDTTPDNRTRTTTVDAQGRVTSQ